jgi:hypothetical protein
MQAALRALKDGPVHRFSEFRTLGDVVPSASAGVYTIWDESGRLVYVGIAGRNPDGTGLDGRLRSHASGRRSGAFRLVPVESYASAMAVDTAIKNGALAKPPMLNPPRAR